MNKIIEQEDKIPAEIKSSWSTTKSVHYQNLKIIMKHTLEQQENEKLDLVRKGKEPCTIQCSEGSSHEVVLVFSYQKYPPKLEISR